MAPKPRREKTGFVLKKASSTRIANTLITNVNQSVISQSSKQRHPITLAPVWKKG
jgi:hypothetical protein